MGRFARVFRPVPDPRADNARHELLDVLFIALVAVLCGAESCSDMADFGQSKEELLRLVLRLEHGIPSHDTFKGNMAPPEEREWFRFVSVRLGNCTELYPDGDNIGVVDTWVPPKLLADVTSTDFLNAVREIRKDKWKKDSWSNNGLESRLPAAWGCHSRWRRKKTASKGSSRCLDQGGQPPGI
jgi:DDE_Tnp_1-associated